MGTAAIVELINADTGMKCRLFCGHDGDIDGIGRDLKHMVDQLNMGWRWAYYSDDVDGLGEYLMIQGFPSRTGVDHYRDG